SSPRMVSSPLRPDKPIRGAGAVVPSGQVGETFRPAPAGKSGGRKPARRRTMATGTARRRCRAGLRDGGRNDREAPIGPADPAGRPAVAADGPRAGEGATESFFHSTIRAARTGKRAAAG